MEITTEEDYTGRDLQPILPFPSLADIKKALNQKKHENASRKRWIRKGKYKFLIQLAAGNMCEKCSRKFLNFCEACQKLCTKKFYVDFPAHFPSKTSVCGILMVKKPFLFFSVTKDAKKETIQGYEYIWQGENYAIIAPFLCQFSNHTARQYVLKITLRLHRHNSKNIVANIIQRSDSLQPNDVWLVSSHPHIDGNFIFSNHTQNEIEDILEKNGAKDKPAKQVWCLFESRWIKGSLVVKYYSLSSRYNGFSQEWYILDQWRKNWLLFDDHHPQEEYTKQYESIWQLSAHMEALYEVLEKNGFSKDGQILPSVENERQV